MWEYQYYGSNDYLAHHGIKGQKWGIRRTKEELAHDKYSIQARSNNIFKKGYRAYGGIKVNRLSAHALERTQDSTRNVTSSEILDALSKPLNRDNMKLRYNSNGQPSYRYIGRYATVNLNPENGVVTTCWKTGKNQIKRYTYGGRADAKRK